jgi:hypothetical protein
MEGIRRYRAIQFGVPALVALSVVGYMGSRYVMYQDRPRSHYAEIEGAAQYIRENTNQDRDVVFVLSKTWSSELAYYSQRKTRMHVELDEDSLSDERFSALQLALRDAGMRVGAVVVAAPVPETLLTRALNAFTPPGLTPPAPARLPLSRERYSGWPIEPGNPSWQAGLVYVIPYAPSGSEALSAP